MQINAIEKQSVVILEILADNGNPANAQNPIEVSEYKEVNFPEVNGNLAIVSGMPMSASVMVALYYKNLFKAIAVANPRAQVAEIVHSVSPNYSVGGVIPLA